MIQLTAEQSSLVVVLEVENVGTENKVELLDLITFELYLICAGLAGMSWFSYCQFSSLKERIWTRGAEFSRE